ncbi:hypothetical protein [Veillonella sp.]|uniref:hypothetical protein n=1 Tax=Veillonella sp. TaxID=1926307 RepID=UPI0035A03CBB
MNKLEILGYIWIFISISLSMGLYKLELSKHVIDEEYEYIKKHRAFGNLTKCLTIIAIVSVVLLNCKFLIDKDYLLPNMVLFGEFTYFLLCAQVFIKSGIVCIINVVFLLFFLYYLVLLV